MPRAPRHWFRFYVEAMQDPKIRGLVPAHRWLWVAVLGIARSSCMPGFLLVAEDMPYADAQIADWAALKVRDVTTGLAELERRGMVAWQADLGCWFITRWVERQYESDNATVRTQRHRSKERRSDDVGTTLERSNNGVGTVVGTDQSRTEQNRTEKELTRSVDDDFEAWWSEWPRKVDRKPAIGAYRARRREGVTHERLIEARNHYIAAKSGTEARYIKHGASFLAKDGPWQEWEHGTPPGELAAIVVPPKSKPSNGEVRMCRLCSNTGNYFRAGVLTECRTHEFR